MTGVILLIISGLLFYFGIKGLRNKSKQSTSNFPDKIEIKLNSNSYNEFIDEVNIGDKVKFWGSPQENGEIRVYCSGTMGGQGLLSVFKNKSIYNFLIKQKKDRKINLVSHVLEKNNNSLIVSLIKEENQFTEEDQLKKFIDKIKKKYSPKETTTFRTRFETSIRLTPKKFNEGLILNFNINEKDLDNIGTKILDRNMGYEESNKWLNSVFWLEFEGEKISINNQTNTVDSSNIIRSYLSGYDFNIEIMKDSSDTYLEKQLMEFEINMFLYYFKVIPVKKI